MLMDVHPGLLGETVWLRNHSLTPKPRMNKNRWGKRAPPGLCVRSSADQAEAVLAAM